jgi:hypothetical protein
MMKIALLALAALVSTSAFAAGDPPAKSVKFPPGAMATTLKGVVKGYVSGGYTLDAVGGQTLHMLFAPSNRSCYFNVAEAGAAEAVHIGSTSGNEFGTNVASNKTYRIDVYLMRNAARRNESCRYKLEIELTGAPGGGSAGVSDPMMRDACKGATALMYGVEPRNITAAAPIRKAKDGGWTIDGSIDKGKEGVKKMRCIFKPDRSVDHVMAMTPDGE